MKYDLHVHTNASDGVLSPGEVLIKAHEAGLSGIAITDHDTVGALAEAQELARNLGSDFKLIPGIEMNTEWDENEIHILGYFINPTYEPLLERLRGLQALRDERAEKIVRKLQALGYRIEMDQVRRLAEGELIGRPHVARALMENGYITTVEEGFIKLLGRGQPAFVPRYEFSPVEAMQLIKEAGGIAVLAHPGLIRDPDKIKKVIELGIEGLEVYYPQHEEEQSRYFARLAEEHNLLITGGSDYHGPGSNENRNHIGMATVDEKMLDRIYEYHRKNAVK